MRTHRKSGVEQHADLPPGVIISGLQTAVPEDPEREHRSHSHAIAELRDTRTACAQRTNETEHSSLDMMSTESIRGGKAPQGGDRNSFDLQAGIEVCIEPRKQAWVIQVLSSSPRGMPTWGGILPKREGTADVRWFAF